MIRFIIAFIASVFMTIIGIPLVAFGLLFVGPEDNHMPHWLWFWDNHEELYGVNGGNKWIAKYGERHRDFWPRFLWTALRNPCHNFDKYTQGVFCLDDLNILWVSQSYVYYTESLDYVREHGGFHYGYIEKQLPGRVIKYPQFAWYGKRLSIRCGWYYQTAQEYKRFCPLIIGWK